MRFEPRARQISRFRPMPVITRYQIPRDRLQVSSAFADAIIAKYTASEGLDLPSASFVYPEMASAAADTMDRLASRLITLNRIRVQMNVYNQRWLHQYALSLSADCRMLLHQLNICSSASPGMVSQTSVRELKRVLRELVPYREGNVQEASLTQPSKPGDAVAAERTQPGREQEEIILRVLTAASRGNGTRERYMSELYRRLQESGKGTRESRPELLDRAVTELLLLKDAGTASAPMMSGWVSEAARRFFWRVQRAPEQERKLLLQAGGYGTVVSLERALKSMDDAQFRRFSMELVDRMQRVSELQETAESVWADGRSSGIEQLVAQISPEEWTVLTELLGKEGYYFTDDGIVPLSADAIPELASEQARQLFWRIQRAPEQERRFFLEAGGFSSMEALGKALQTMDDVTFRKFSAQLLERMHRFAKAPGQSAAVPADQRIGTDDSADAQSMQTSDAAQKRDPDADGRLRTQKQIFLRQLNTGSEAAAVLEKVLRTVTEQRQVLAENTQIFDTLSESVLNMTMDDWTRFRTDIARVTESEVPRGVSFSFLQPTGAADTKMSAERGAETLVYTKDAAPAEIETLRMADTDHLTRTASETLRREETLRKEETLQREDALRVQGIRMSREKTEMIRKLRILSRVPDNSLRTLERFLREHTTLRETNPAEDGQHSYQTLTVRERENWHSFIMDILSEPDESGKQSIPSEQVFLRIHTGADRSLLNLLQEGSSGRDAAQGTVERLREERVFAGELPLQGQSQSILTGISGTFSWLQREPRLSSAGDTAGERVNRMSSSVRGNSMRSNPMGDNSPGSSRMAGNALSGGQDIEPMPADMEVPRRAEPVHQEAQAPGRQGTEERSASEYRDIEFETTSYHTEERSVRETAASLGDVMNRLDQQQREIERLRNTQQKIAERNVSRDILKKLDDRVQMERLRGGRQHS